MDIVYFGQQNWDVCWTAKQQLTSRLARRGHRILYIDPLPGPTASLSAALGQTALPSRVTPGLRTLDTNLHVFSYSPFPGAGRRLNAKRRPLVLRGLLGRFGMAAPVAVISIPARRWLMDAIDPAACIYYAVDEWTGFGGLSDAQKEQLRRDEEAVLAQCDVALAVSPRLLERFRTVQPRSYLQENAADVDHFSPGRLAAATPHPGVAPLPRPRLGFVGQVDERVDQDLVLRMAKERPDWQIVLAGRVRDGVDVSALEAQPNVHLLGYVPYAELPGVLREYDVCLVPYRSSNLTQSCNPLKVYEYLATGLPVVSTPLEGLNTCREAVSLADSPEGFMGAVEAALADPAAGREQRLNVAAENTWERRTDLLEERLEEALRAARDRKGASPARTTLPARQAARHDFSLDAKDDSERQLKDNFRKARLTPAQKAAFHLTAAAGRAYYAARVVSRALRGQPEPRTQRILVVRHALLGDFVTFLPTLRALRKRYPRAHIALGVQPKMTASVLLEGSNYIDETVTLDFMGRSSRADRLRGAWDLFRRGYDVVVTGASYYLIKEALFCGAPRRVSLYDRHPWQEAGGKVVVLDPNRHETDNNLAVVAALGASLDEDEAAPTLALSAEAAAEAFAPAAEAVGLSAEWPVVTMHPGGARASRRWPAERFAQLATALLREQTDLRVVLTGVPDEAPLAEAVQRGIPDALIDRVLSVVGKTKLPALLGLLDRSDLVVSNDTGVLHLARARNRPLVALLGPENDRRWGPYPRGKAPAVALRHVVPCSPCVRQDCEGHYCARSLTVDEALEACRQLLGGYAPQPAEYVEYRKRHHSWAELRESGFAVPRVSVVLMPEAVAEETLAALARQTYPNTEILLALPEGCGADLPETSAMLRCISLGSSDSSVTWQRILAEAEGDFLLILRGSDLGSPHRIGDDVAALYRTPTAAGAASPQVFNLTGLRTLGDPWLTSVMVRRESVAKLLPLPEAGRAHAPALASSTE